MSDVVSYGGDSGLMAILKALDNLRLLLAMSDVEPQQAAGYLGCIVVHLAEITGLGGDFVEDIEECGGLLCPNCKAWVGSIYNLSARCHLCQAPLFPKAEGAPPPTRNAESGS
jgi:hypothetical protein